MWIKQYWLEALFSGALTLLSIAVKKIYTNIKLEKEEQHLIKEGLIAILHDRLFQECERLITKCSISTQEMCNLESMYKAYHDLGGNGTGTEMYERCLKLEIKLQR